MDTSDLQLRTFLLPIDNLNPDKSYRKCIFNSEGGDI